MNKIDNLIEACQRKLVANAIKIEQLNEASRVLSIKIQNLTNLVDDAGNSPSGVNEPVFAETCKHTLLGNRSVVDNMHNELQGVNRELLNRLRSLRSPVRRGGKKNKTAKKIRRKKVIS